jgi:lipoyl(octanoyl) transferase
MEPCVLLLLLLLLLLLVWDENVSALQLRPSVKVYNFMTSRRDVAPASGGLLPYQQGLEVQKSLFIDQLEARKNYVSSQQNDPNVGAIPGGSLIVCEHNPVYTFGTGTTGTSCSGSGSGPFTRDLMDEHGERLPFDTMTVDRAGQGTFHGPGQIVLYPILDMQLMPAINRDIHKYLRTLEEVVVDTCIKDLHFPVEKARVGRMPGFTGASINTNIVPIILIFYGAGVWVNDEVKIAAIGVKIMKYITMHGIAVNYDTNMRYFSNISPCGLTIGRPGTIAEFIDTTKFSKEHGL